MKPLSEIVPTDVARALYEAGYMVVRRPFGDPLDPPPGTVPKDRVYQWMHMVADKIHWADQQGKPTLGWTPVEHERHPGVFGPIGAEGHIIKSGLGLFDKPKFEVDRERQSNIDAARKQSEDFFKNLIDLGITGGARIVEESGGAGQPHKVVERTGAPIDMPGEPKSVPAAQVAIPADMRPHLQRLITVRDEVLAKLIGDQTVDDDARLLLKYRAMTQAIERVRIEIRKPKGDA